MATSNNIKHNKMETIRVRKLNHAVLQIDCNSGTSAELRDFFSFYVPGYKFMPAYKNRVWDGKIDYIIKLRVSCRQVYFHKC